MTPQYGGAGGLAPQGCLDKSGATCATASGHGLAVGNQADPVLIAKKAFNAGGCSGHQGLPACRLRCCQLQGPFPGPLQRAGPLPWRSHGLMERAGFCVALKG